MNIQKQISIWICMALCAILLIGCAGTAPQDTSVISDVSEAEAMETAKTVAELLKDKLGADGLNVVQNNGAAAGQTVNHFHMHIIPRYKGDGQTILWKPGHPTDAELDEVCAKILG